MGYVKEKLIKSGQKSTRQFFKKQQELAEARKEKNPLVGILSKETKERLTNRAVEAEGASDSEVSLEEEIHLSVSVKKVSSSVPSSPTTPRKRFESKKEEAFSSELSVVSPRAFAIEQKSSPIKRLSPLFKTWSNMIISDHVINF